MEQLSIPDLDQYLAGFLLFADLAGVFFFAVSGALLAVRREFDIVGSSLLASLAGLGGGVVRDIIINQGVPNAFAQPIYLLPVALAVFLVYTTLIRDTWLRRTLLAFDAAGLALFCVTGAEIAMRAGMHPVSGALLGTTTAVVGGLLRDVVANQVPDIFNRRGVYAIPALVGATATVILYELGWFTALTGTLVVVFVFCFRLIALRFRWRVPAASWTQEQELQEYLRRARDTRRMPPNQRTDASESSDED